MVLAIITCGIPRLMSEAKPAESATPLQCPTIGPMSKGDFDTILAAAGNAPTAYTVTFPPMTTAAAIAAARRRGSRT